MRAIDAGWVGTIRITTLRTRIHLDILHSLIKFQVQSGVAAMRGLRRTWVAVRRCARSGWRAGGVCAVLPPAQRGGNGPDTAAMRSTRPLRRGHRSFRLSSGGRRRSIWIRSTPAVSF